MTVLMTSQQIHAAGPGIIGEDNRTQVVSLQDDPFYASVGMILNNETGNYCSGTLISPKHVLTNGHCVIPSQKFPSTILNPKVLTFNPGRLGFSDGPLGPLKVVRIKTSARWVQTGDADYDVAVIELEKPVSIPFIKLVSFVHPGYLDGKVVYITGYTSREDFGTMWNAQGRVESIFNGEQSFIHNVDTVHGTSGSLVRMQYGNQWVGIGIHRGTYLGGKEEKNRGVLFNAMIYAAIKRWMM